MKKLIVKFNSEKESGNIYAILAQVSTALKKADRKSEFNGIRDRVFASKSYAEALAAIRETINLIDEAGKV